MRSNKMFLGLKKKKSYFLQEMDNNILENR